MTITGIGVSGGSPQGFFIAPWGAFHLQFSLGSSGGTGAFTGGLGGILGSPLSNNVITSEDIDAFFNGCASSKGVKALHIGIGTLSLP